MKDTQNTTTATGTATRKERIIQFLTDSKIDIDFAYHLQDAEFESAEEIRDLLEDANCFEIDIIYYARAIAFLMENDPSLHTSLEIAHEHGFTADNLNSEILASLLASDLIREEFRELESDLESFLDELAEEIENNKSSILDDFNGRFNTELESFEDIESFLDDEASEFITEDERTEFLKYWESEYILISEE